MFHQPEREHEAAALLEDIQAKAPEIRLGQRHVDLAFLLQLLLEMLRDHVLDHLRDPVGRRRGGIEGRELPMDAEDDRAVRFQMNVGRARLNRGLQDLAKGFHGVLGGL